MSTAVTISVSGLPFDFFRRLCDEESDGVGRKFGPPRVDRDLVVGTLVGLHLDGQQEQLQLDETEPETEGLRDVSQIDIRQNDT